MHALTTRYRHLATRLREGGDWLWPLGLRLILAWEFFDSGLTKLRGSNWFGSVLDQFPFPFDRLGAELNWLAATWGELAFAVLLALGLFTRLAAFSLLIITVVATAAVHWPAEWASLAELWKGYAITDRGHGNFKLPLLFALMLLPLVFHGAGRLSLDALVARLAGRQRPPAHHSPALTGEATGWALLIPGVALLFLLPMAAAALVAAGALLVAWGRRGSGAAEQERGA